MEKKIDSFIAIEELAIEFGVNYQTLYQCVRKYKNNFNTKKVNNILYIEKDFLKDIKSYKEFKEKNVSLISPDGYYNVKESLKILKKTKGTLQRYIKSGIIKDTKKIGYNLFISKKDIENLLDGKSKKKQT